MQPLKLADVTAYVKENIGAFHAAQIEKIKRLTLKEVLKRKNPYLFKAKDIKNVEALIREILTAFLSSGEETRFGNFLEPLAIFINNKVYGGQKAAMRGIDLDFEKDGTRYLVSIKSGPSWGNSSQIEKMIQHFNSAKKTLRTSGGHQGSIEFINGCCYGRDNKPVKEHGYSKLCGQRFWEFISGNENLYEDLIIPLDHGAREGNERFQAEYDKACDRLVKEFHTAGLA